MKNFNRSSIAIVATLVVSLVLGITGPISAFAAGPATVDLGTSGNFAILSKAGISTTGVTSITGDIGVSPIGYAAITGFTLIPAVPDGSNTFSTSALVTGKVYAVGYTEPTPTNLGISLLNMQAAYTDALSRAADATDIINVNAGEIGGLTFAPGVYKYTGANSNVLISTDVTLSGGANDVWIFQIPGTLNIASGANVPSGVKVSLIGEAQASNVFWAVAGATTLGTYSTFNGNILDATNVAIQTGAVLNGRALAQTAVTLDANIITVPTAVTTGPVFIDKNVNGVLDSGEQSFNTIQAAIAAATSSDTIHVTAGTYPEVGQIVIDKNLTIVGDASSTTIIKPAQNTTNTSHADSAAWILVNSSSTFNLSNVTLDGSGKLIAIGILSHGHGTINNDVFTNIAYNQSTDYEGIAIELYGSDMTVSNNNFSNIGRIGVYNGFGTISTISGNTYAGKGTGNWLDYAFEVGRNGQAAISSNTISNNVGVATVDGSTSAGILVTSYYNPETPSSATITGNTISSSTDGIAVGYDANDASIVVAHNNNLSGNAVTGIVSTHPTVDATNNWWGTGDKTGIPALISGNVNFTPWCGNSACSAPNNSNSGLEVTSTLTSPVSATTTTSVGLIQIDVASSTTVTGPSTWDGTLNTTPTVTSNFIVPDHSSSDVSVLSSIEVGDGDVPLTLSNAVRLLFAGQAANLVGYSRGGVFTPITNVCADDTQVTNNLLASGADCKIASGADLVVWTKHFTVFSTYTQTPWFVSVGGGGGGGGGSYYPPVSTPTPTPAPVAGQVLGVSTFNFTNDLSVGSRGNDVTELQNKLTKEGVYSGPITGYFGSLTLAGVKAYQAKYGISQVGSVNSLTRAQLNGSQVAGVSTVNSAAVNAQIATIQSQLAALLQQLAQALQTQINQYK